MKLLLEALVRLFVIVWLSVFALGVVMLLHGGIGRISLWAMALTALAATIPALLAPTAARRWGGWFAVFGALWLLFPLTHAAGRLAADSTFAWDDTLYRQVVAGGSGTVFMAQLGLVLGLLALTIGLVLWAKGRPGEGNRDAVTMLALREVAGRLHGKAVRFMEDPKPPRAPWVPAPDHDRGLLAGLSEAPEGDESEADVAARERA